MVVWRNAPFKQLERRVGVNRWSQLELKLGSCREPVQDKRVVHTVVIAGMDGTDEVFVAGEVVPAAEQIAC